MSFCIGKDRLTNGAKILETNDRGALLELDKEGAGILIPEFLSRKERYFIFKVKVLEEHSVSMNLLIYGEDPAEPVMNIRFGILPKLETQMCIDRTWFEGNVLFPENLAGDLKIVCHGRRIAQEEITRVELSSLQAFHNQKIVLTDLDFVKEAPEVNLTDEKLVDAFGQNKRKEWKEKIHSEEELKEKMNCQLAEQGKPFPFADWSKYGGWTRKKLTEGTGFFSRIKEDNGKWWLVDPLGYAFLSIGPDCVGPEIDCRIDGLEKNLDWLPSEDDSDYGVFFQSQHVIPGRRRNFKSFSYSKANLYRVWGEKWKENWRPMIVGQLKAHGMNTLGNWSSDELFGTTEIPYVTSLPEFPTTKQNIFRDFPDVFNEEYEETAKKNAQELAPRANDPWMIGYFLRNEPSWAFVDNLVLADETLYNPARTSCKEKLIARMEEKYQSIYGFGQKTGIDLPGEANTASLMYQVEDMKPIDLATNAFGQNYNCTMVQMVSGFASLINGGTYYQPHLVTKITDTTGNTISTVEPKAVKQTISQSTSDKIRDYLQSVVKEGTGNTAKVDGYSMGGKTGTAQKFPRGNGKYLVSFMGFAPYDNPQVLIYVVVNEPNVADQPHSVFAQNIAREILEEVLPYMNIYPDEKKTGVNKGYDVTGSKDSSQYTGKHNGTKSRNEKKKKN